MNDDVISMEKLSLDDIIELEGVVVKIKRYGRSLTDKGVIFILNVEINNIYKQYDCKVNGFCAVREYDLVSGKAKYNNFTKIYEFVAHPLILIPPNTDAIRYVFRKACGHIATRENEEFLNHILKIYEKGTFNYLCKLSDDYVKSKKREYIVQYSDVIRPEILSKILHQWNRDVNYRRLYLFGLTNKDIINSKLSTLILYSKITHNPYQINTLNLDKCKYIIDIMEVELSDEEYIMGMLTREIKSNLTKYRWLFTPISELKHKYLASDESFEKYKQRLIEKYDILISNNNIYIYRYYVMSSYIATTFIQLSKTKYPKITEIIFNNNELSVQQKNAITYALNNGLTIIKGFAGTGKTSVIKELVDQINNHKMTSYVLSFTGKAVSVIINKGENIVASTIHRFLISGIDSVHYLIIDEISTVGIELMYNLLNYFKIIPRLVLIGDNNQLPPIDPGDLFQELLKVNFCESFHLDKIFRNSEVLGKDGSLCNGIVENSLSIIKDFPVCLQEYDNFQIMGGGIQTIIKLVNTFKNNGIEKKDFSIIAPYNRCLNSLNCACQEIYAEGSYATDTLGRKWYIGDKVMMLVNNYEINVMNGEEGIVIEIDSDKIKVRFGTDTDTDSEFLFSLNAKVLKDDTDTGTEVYEEKELTVDSISHSYAITIDKSQGSEWKYIILYIPSGTVNTKFINKRRLYTAITRAKLGIWCIVNSIEILNDCANTQEIFANENLSTMLKSLILT